ncbi:hypothetical protein ACX40Y_10780 [Sphingomonas sp. RS6]
MRIGFAALFGEAGALWRAERQLVTRVASVFLFLPLLGIILLIATSAPPLDVPPDQLSQTLNDFYRQFSQRNLVPLAIANFAMDYGLFALLNLYFQGSGRTLGGVLSHSLRWLFPFLLIELAVGLLFSVGFSLFVLPGLFLFARTWLVAPAFAVNPQAGLIAAAKQGWARSGGTVWLVLLGACALVFVAGFAAMAVASLLLGLVSAAVGGGAAIEAITFVVLAAVAMLVWTALALLRVAAYRATESDEGRRQGM